MKRAIQTPSPVGSDRHVAATPKVVNIIDALSELQPKLAPRSPCDLCARKSGADLSQSVLIADDRQVPHRGGEKCS